jgi:hypothetical protein
MMAHERPSRCVSSGWLVPGPANDRANRPAPLHLQYDTISLEKEKSGIFPHCLVHAIVASASTAPPTHCWPFPTRWPSPAVAFPSGRRAPTSPRCCHALIPHRSFPPVAFAHPVPLALALSCVLLTRPSQARCY